jgi:hypothetical protein
MLKSTADGGEQRQRERLHFEELINEKENNIHALNDRLMKRE